MRSRERLLNSFERQPVDRVPMLLRFWSLGGDEDNIPFDWRDEVTRVEHTLALGLDDTIMLQPPLGYVEEYRPESLSQVSSHTELLEPGEGERYPRLLKTYETPAGTLQTAVSCTEDCPQGQDLMLFDDHNIPRLVEPLIKTAADLDALRYVLGEPAPDQLVDWQDRAVHLYGEASRLGVLLDGGWIALGDALMWLCGMERVLYGQMDEPEFLDQVLEIIHQWEMRRIDYLLAQDVDEIVHMAWYETTDFWTPRSYRRLLKPRLQAEIERTHAAGKKYRYIITKSWKPYITDLLELGIDCLTGVDPVQDSIDLAEVKQAVGDKICLMGGLNSAVMLSQWSDEQIRKAVIDAFEVLAPGGGFIAFPVDAIFNTTPWSKVECMLHAWRESNLNAGYDI